MLKERAGGSGLGRVTRLPAPLGAESCQPCLLPLGIKLFCPLVLWEHLQQQELPPPSHTKCYFLQGVFSLEKNVVLICRIIVLSSMGYNSYSSLESSRNFCFEWD